MWSLKHLVVQVVIIEPKVSGLVSQIYNLLLQLALTCLVVGLHAVVALTLHMDGLLEYFLLLFL